MIIVRCRNCGARYETSLPAASVRRVARCPECRLRSLEIVDDRDPPGDAGRAQEPITADDPGS